VKKKSLTRIRLDTPLRIYLRKKREEESERKTKHFFYQSPPFTSPIKLVPTCLLPVETAQSSIRSEGFVAEFSSPTSSSSSSCSRAEANASSDILLQWGASRARSPGRTTGRACGHRRRTRSSATTFSAMATAAGARSLRKPVRPIAARRCRRRVIHYPCRPPHAAFALPKHNSRALGALHRQLCTEAHTQNR
jgi:hypothetical protein